MKASAIFFSFPVQLVVLYYSDQEFTMSANILSIFLLEQDYAFNF